MGGESGRGVSGGGGSGGRTRLSKSVGFARALSLPVATARAGFRGHKPESAKSTGISRDVRVDCP